MANHPLHASKWLSFYLLLDPIEMKELIESIKPIEFYSVGVPLAEGKQKRDQEEFLGFYQDYCQTLSSGQNPDDLFFKKAFSCALTADPNDLYFKKLDPHRMIGMILKPLIIMQLNNVGYSKDQNVHAFRPMVHGSNTFTWGIGLSFPQLYENAENGEILETFKEKLSNAIKFKEIRRFIQNQTIPTPFIVEGKQINATVRIGKKAQEWVNHHPQLKEKNISVATHPS